MPLMVLLRFHAAHGLVESLALHGGMGGNVQFPPAVVPAFTLICRSIRATSSVKSIVIGFADFLLKSHPFKFAVKEANEATPSTSNAAYFAIVEMTSREIFKFPFGCVFSWFCIISNPLFAIYYIIQFKIYNHF